MKLHRIICTLAIAPFFATGSYAFMCPSTFNQIDFGDTIAQVEQQCGKADKTESMEAPDDNQPQQWDYYLEQSTPNHALMLVQQENTTLKATFAFDAQGNLVNISINGVGVGSTNNCGGSNISIGDTRKQVEAACGKPSFVNKQAPSPVQATAQGANMQVTMTYNSNPPVTLVFRNGKLAEKR